MLYRENIASVAVVLPDGHTCTIFLRPSHIFWEALGGPAQVMNGDDGFLCVLQLPGKPSRRNQCC